MHDHDIPDAHDPLQPVHRQLVMDGAAWQNHVPSATRLMDYARTLPEREEPDQSQALFSVTPLSHPARALSSNRAQHFPARQRWLSGLLVILVISLAGLIYVLVPHGPANHTQTTTSQTSLPAPTGTPAPTVAPTGSPTVTTQPATLGTWQLEQGLAYPVANLDSSTAVSVPAIAPTNPNLVYEAFYESGNTTPILRRTTDGGADWTNLPVPSQVQAGSVEMSVDPTQPQTVWLSYFHQGYQNCPPQNQIPSDAAGTCAFYYASTDSGQTWHLLHMPTNMGAYNFDALYPQQQRLYLTVASGISTTCQTVVSSTDGGLTWQTLTVAKTVRISALVAL